jgi:hypothetical protein
MHEVVIPKKERAKGTEKITMGTECRTIWGK